MEHDGIYIAYVSASEGYSAILFVLRDGRITGADIGGVQYAGKYDVGASSLKGALTVTYPPNAELVTGHSVGDQGLAISVPFEIEMEEIGKGIINLSTPVGPVSASLRRVQDLP